ncbi:putative isoflavone reductase like protein P3 [Amylocarpus encephaloides]|uniref:Isoflavone reductase like protein P3 n=1 Tax=Amylocarpus encephaloides TaxID=45428 RepID=A0A9P7YN54_9HELO|nr:putative isoflavone reductase like protein P3 [Amylocarpus encephaloides]
MVEIKNVAVVGGTGTLGTPVLNEIVNSGKFNVIVLTRSSSTNKPSFPASVKVVPVDETSVESLTAALKGQDAVVSTVGTPGFLGQTVLIDAAIAAGVKRFLPSEFGSDLDNPKSAALPVFGYKITVDKHLKEAIAAQSGEKMTYTSVRNSIFLDWGIQFGFFGDFKNGKVSVYDGGEVPFGTTTLASIGKAVVGVLTHYEETKNRAVYVYDIAITQNRLIELAKKVAPETKFELTPVKTEDLRRSSDAALAKGDYSEGVIIPYLYSSIFAEGYGTLAANPDNELLGIKGKTEADVEALIREAIA